MKLGYIIIRAKQKTVQTVYCKRGTGSKKAKTVFSAGKVVATVFWDSHGVILIDYLQKGKTITGEYFAPLLDTLKAELAEKQPHLQRKKIPFHQDNAPSHTSAVAMAKIHELRFKLLDYSPYSPDLALSDFFLFPHLKIALGGQKFSSNEQVINFVNYYFAKKTPSTIRRVTDMGASLGEVYRVTRGLC